MTFELDVDQQQRYREQGYLSPLPVFTPLEVAALRQAFESFEGAVGPDRVAGLRTDLHLIQQWAWDAVTDPRIIDPIVSLLGPDVLLWSLNWFIKESGDGKFVSLHQDANYWGLYPYEVVTAWVALSDATQATGPMSFVPGSHLTGLVEHENTFAQDNLLTRGQTAQIDVDPEQAVLAPLQAGEMSLHHVCLLHGSGPNTSADRRIGMVLRFCAAHVRQTKGADTAVLVAGEDRYGHFDLLPEPQQDLGEAECARHLDAVTKMGKIIMADE